jgi:hypothetical protein
MTGSRGAANCADSTNSNKESRNAGSPLPFPYLKLARCQRSFSATIARLLLSRKTFLDSSFPDSKILPLLWRIQLVPTVASCNYRFDGTILKCERDQQSDNKLDLSQSLLRALRSSLKQNSNGPAKSQCGDIYSEQHPEFRGP